MRLHLIRFLLALTLAFQPFAVLRAKQPPLIVTATSYSWREPSHHRYGRLNALGTRLDDSQIAADWRFYPPGTVMWIQGLGFRIVTDRGRAVTGPRHIDIHFSSLAAMRSWDTRRVHIRILRKP
ncbi:MAG: 3D domain-containing protein [Methylacidiphilales bacterium]|nr:3D domain-containing protein [Candidatus Methylacidiphilales bacterium]